MKDLLNLWRAQGVARKCLVGHSAALTRSAPIGTMAFQEFIEFLCKVAQLAFPHKSATQAMDKLRRKLSLQDESRVRRVIDERGGPSCYRINYPSDPCGEDLKLLTRELLLESSFKYPAVRHNPPLPLPPLTTSASSRSIDPQVQFCVEGKDTVEWRRRYSELVKDQCLIPTKGLDFSTLMLKQHLLHTLAAYDPSHIEALQPYVFGVRRSWAPLSVPALDLGVLYVGQAYCLQLLVKNTFSVPLALKVPQLRGSHLKSNMREFTMDATSTVCPGLAFNLVVELEPVLDIGRSQEVYGAIELDMTKEETILHHTKTASAQRPPALDKYCIPVYFQVTHPP